MSHRSALGQSNPALPKPIAVFASGAGSNFEALLKSPEHGTVYEIALLVSDRPDSGAVEKAAKAGIPILSFNPRRFSSKAEFEAVIVDLCKRLYIDWLVLTGYMRLVGETLLLAFPERIINIHPSILPAFPGKHAIEQAIDAKVSSTGVTVHFVDSGMDTGPIIAQERVEIESGDTAEALRTRIQQVEHSLLPRIVKDLLQK